MSRLCEEIKIVPIISAVDLAGGAATAESVCMKNYRHVTFVFNFGNITGDSVLTIAEGATDAAATSAVTFSYRATAIACGTALSDVLGTESTSAALTLTAASYTNMTLVVEIDAAEMTDGYDWLTPAISAVANPCLVSCVAYLYPKYAGASLHTALA